LFHGNGDTASNFCASTGACQHFASKGFFVAVPDGRRRNVTALGQTINNIAWDGYNLTPETNEDLALFDLIASDFKSRCQVDEIYVVGHSQGGYLAATLAMIRSQDLFGVGVAAASEALPGYSWQPQKKTPVVFVIGTADYGYNSADNFFKKLQSQGYATDFHPIQGLNHGPFPRGAEATMSAFFEANR
jgi:poly(3-hydroxybutyrate) depolymerase